MIEILDELGVEWGMVRTNINLTLDPRDWKDGWSASLIIEAPVGYIKAEKVTEAQTRLEAPNAS